MARTPALSLPTTASAVILLLLLLAPARASAQELVDDFNRADNNVVGGGWTETESSAVGARVNGNRLSLARTAAANGRQYVTMTTPGGYSTTLNANGCLMTWAFSFRQSENEGELSGFDSGDDGVAVVLAGSNANLTTGTGYAVVLGESGNTDRLRLVRYNGGLDADGNLTNVIATGNFDNEYLDVRVTYLPSTNTWGLFYRSNAGTVFSNPLTASTSGGSAVDNTYTGSAHGIIGALWNHDGDNGEEAVVDYFLVPGGTPNVPVITPASVSACVGSPVSLMAASSTTSTARATFTSSGGPATVSAVGANNGSVYPWSINASGLPTSGVIVESVTINGVTHTYPDDLDLLLQSPTGTNVILMSDVGGGTDITNRNYSFMDGSPAMNDDTQNQSGMYAPVNSGTPDSWPTAPGPGTISQTGPLLSNFTGNLNGTWNLLIRDDANVDAGQVASWSITFSYTATVSYAWSPASGLNTTAGATVIATPPSTQAYTVTGSHAANACTSLGNVTVTIVTTPCVYYSQLSGTVNDPIWNSAPSGPPGAASFDAGISMVVQNGHSVTHTSSTNVKNVTVDNGGKLVLDGNTVLTVSGTNISLIGALVANDDSEVLLNSGAATAVTLNGAKSFWDLSVNTSAGTTVTGTAEIRGTLLLQNGNFNCTGNQVVLRSTASTTGRLGPVGATASYTGNMKIERYVPAGATNWRLLGSSISGRKVNHWMDDFATAGFPGSQAPWFDSPVGSGNLWPSIRWYDETHVGGGQNDGMTGVSGNTHNLTSGQGFAAWCGTSLNTTTAFVVDLENQPPVIASTPITLPMTWTNTGNPVVDGWNLVSNPVPSPIAFDQIARGANVADFVTYFDPATGNTATWDISLGAGTNGGTNTIQSSQGFFLKANGPAVTTTVEEADKVEGNGGGFFGGLVENAPAVLHLAVTSSINTFSDETLVVFSEGDPEVNGDDVPKYIFGHPDAPQMASMGADGELMAINAYGPYTTSISIPLMMDAGVTGTYTVTATGVASMGLSCLSIEDLLTGMITPLAEGTTYSFDMDASTDPSLPRLMLHATAPLPFTVVDAACAGDVNGSATVEVAGGPADVLWMNDQGTVIDQQNGVAGNSTLDALAAGDYQIQVIGIGGCGALTQAFSVDEPMILNATGTVLDASCPNTADGHVTLEVTGGTAPFTFAWSNGSDANDLTAMAGEYSVIVTDAHNCAVQSGVFTIASGMGPVAAIDAQDLLVTVGTAVVFINNSTEGSAYAWEFGDGSTSTDVAPEHTYDQPGQYTVVLTVNDGVCTATTTIVITVELSTGIGETAVANASAWLNGDHLVVEHGLSDLLPVTVEIMNEAGQLFRQLKVAGPTGRLTIPATDLSNGIWYVRVSNTETRRTIPVVVVR